MLVGAYCREAIDRGKGGEEGRRTRAYDFLEDLANLVDPRSEPNIVKY